MIGGAPITVIRDSAVEGRTVQATVHFSSVQIFHGMACKEQSESSKNPFRDPDASCQRAKRKYGPDLTFTSEVKIFIVIWQSLWILEPPIFSGPLNELLVSVKFSTEDVCRYFQ